MACNVKIKADSGSNDSIVVPILSSPVLTRSIYLETSEAGPSSAVLAHKLFFNEQLRHLSTVMLCAAARDVLFEIA